MVWMLTFHCLSLLEGAVIIASVGSRMTIDEEKMQFASHVVDIMQVIGPVYAKRMFGGHGIFLDGLMFALIADNSLYLKVDDETRPAFDEQGLMPFTYQKKGSTASLSYYQAPEEAMEDLEKMRDWAVPAFEAALRAAARKHKKSTRKSA